MRRYRALLTDDGETGITNSEYDARAAERNAPAVTTLRRMTGMASWDDILAWFDLLPAPAKLRTCPNCGKSFKALGFRAPLRQVQRQRSGTHGRRGSRAETAIIEWEGRALKARRGNRHSGYLLAMMTRKPNYKPPVILPRLVCT